MSLLGKIVVGGIVTAVGVFIVLKTDKVLGFFGRVPWAEQHLGLEGGSRLFYKLLGVLLCFVGFAVMTGLGKALFLGTVGRLLFIN
jgi:hypothetical protein